MYLLLWEGPGLTLGRLRRSGNGACCGARDGRGGSNGLDMAIKGIALGTGLVTIRNAMN